VTDEDAAEEDAELAEAELVEAELADADELDASVALSEVDATPPPLPSCSSSVPMSEHPPRNAANGSANRECRRGIKGR